MANGGQVLLSQEAWIRLRGNMFAAGFPVVEQLGLYKLNAWPVPICIYQVTVLHVVTTRAHRSMPCSSIAATKVCLF